MVSLMKVRVYPGKTFEEFGAIRFELTYETVRPGADLGDIDPDNDLIWHGIGFKTVEAARKKAAQILKSDITAFGQVEIQEQRVDWFVEEDRVAEWADVGELEQICMGDVMETKETL